MSVMALPVCVIPLAPVTPLLFPKALSALCPDEDSKETGQHCQIETPFEVLKRRFSALSASPIFATRLPRAAVGSAAGAETKDALRIIGMGSCGTVYEIPGTEMVLKKGRDSSAIFQDFQLTNKLHYAIKKSRALLQQEFPNATIPQSPECYEFHFADDKEFWTDSLKQRFPANRRAPGPVFGATRILPLPKVVREALINIYFDESESVQQEARDDRDNKDCLIRVYMGERETLSQQNECYSTLRNFELRLNMMGDIGLDLTELASEMAIGLAIVHWQAQVDAMDSEFVLGSSASYDRTHAVLEAHKGSSARLTNFHRREIHMWILDFDKASVIDLTERDVERRLVPAFVGNDPYFPLPCDDTDDEDQELWEAFSTTYLKASAVILNAKMVETGIGQGQDRDSVMGLPKLFLEKVEKRVQENAQWDTEDHIIFA